MTSNPPSGPNNDNAGLIESIRRYLALKLGFAEPPPIVQAEVVLRERTLDGIVEWILSTRCRNIITLAGAGISTAAGIPDFRSPGTGLYHNLQKYKLPNPQAIFEINYFKSNPKPFYVLAKELFPGKFKPTISHYFIRLLHEKGVLLRHYTQNIDTLERIAEIPTNKLVEAHGTFETARCLDCGRQYELKFIKAHIFRDLIPFCRDCKGIVKPDIVFFGESLPARFQECLNEDFKKCDLLIIMGSSLEVQPFASLVDMVPDWCPRLLINREKAGVKPRVYSQFGINIGLKFEDGYRDVALLGNCDDGCMKLAEKLCWEGELQDLVEREHKRLEKDGYHHMHLPESGNLPPYKPYVIAPLPGECMKECNTLTGSGKPQACLPKPVEPQPQASGLKPQSPGKAPETSTGPVPFAGKPPAVKPDQEMKETVSNPKLSRTPTKASVHFEPLPKSK